MSYQQFSSYLSDAHIAKCKQRHNIFLFANISMNHFSLNAQLAQEAIRSTFAWVSICKGFVSSCSVLFLPVYEKWSSIACFWPDPQPGVKPWQVQHDPLAHPAREKWHPFRSYTRFCLIQSLLGLWDLELSSWPGIYLFQTSMWINLHNPKCLSPFDITTHIYIADVLAATASP